MTISVHDLFGQLNQKKLDALVQSIDMGLQSSEKQDYSRDSLFPKIHPSTFEGRPRKAEIKNNAFH
jgi:hypothetical protein